MNIKFIILYICSSVCLHAEFEHRLLERDIKIAKKPANEVLNLLSIKTGVKITFVEYFLEPQEDYITEVVEYVSCDVDAKKGDSIHLLIVNICHMNRWTCRFNDDGSIIVYNKRIQTR